MPKTDLTTRSARRRGRDYARRLVHTCPRARLFGGINADNDRRNSTAYACFNAIRDCGNPSFRIRTTWINGMRLRHDVDSDKFFDRLLSAYHRSKCEKFIAIFCKQLKYFRKTYKIISFNNFDIEYWKGIIMRIMTSKRPITFARPRRRRGGHDSSCLIARSRGKYAPRHVHRP